MDFNKHRVDEWACGQRHVGVGVGHQCGHEHGHCIKACGREQYRHTSMMRRPVIVGVGAEARGMGKAVSVNLGVSMAVSRDDGVGSEYRHGHRYGCGCRQWAGA